MRRRDYEGAEAIYRRLLTHFQSWSSPRAEPAVATTLRAARAGSRGARLLERCRIVVPAGAGDPRAAGQGREAATVAQQLGGVIEAQERFEDAAGWYTQALERFEQLGLEREASTSMQRLGQMAVKRRGWTRPIPGCTGGRDRRAAGAARDTAAIMQSLGKVAQEREQLEEAESWYSKALERFEQLGLHGRGRGDGLRARDSLGDRAAARSLPRSPAPGRGAGWSAGAVPAPPGCTAGAGEGRGDAPRPDGDSAPPRAGARPRRRPHADAAPRGDRRACQGHADRRRGSAAPGLAGAVRRREPAPGRDRPDAAQSGETDRPRCW